METAKYYSDTIEGWFNWKHLYDEWAKSSRNGDVIIEIGSFYGKSTIYLAEKLKELNKDVKIIAVDAYSLGLHGTTQFDNGFLTNFLVFKEHIYKADVEKYIVPIVADSKLVSCILKPYYNRVAYIYIDGNHTYEGCYSDIVGYYPLLRPTGVMAGHDYEPNNWAGVVKAVHDYANLMELTVSNVDDTWIYSNRAKDAERKKS